MKERQKRMLRFLLTQKTAVRIDDLAHTFSIGKRTVSRDLDILESWCSLRGVLLERKPNQGIQVISFGKDPARLLEILNTPESYLETLPPQTRQHLILLYLIFHNREIKISEIAQTFFISDTSVWNDLNQLETSLDPEIFTLMRMKGIGIKLEGKERMMRMEFLHILTNLFSSHTIIPYIYSLKEDDSHTLEINQFRLLMKRIHFPDSNPSVLSLISQAGRQLGYHFTMSGETLLYFYLQLSSHRIQSGALICREDVPPCSAPYRETAQKVLHTLTERIVCGRLPEEEIAFLGLFLEGLEIGDLQEEQTLLPDLFPSEITHFTDSLLEAFGKQDNQLYYLDREMEQLLNLSVSSLIIRLRNHFPYWHGEWGSPSSETWARSNKDQLLLQLLKEQFDLNARKEDMDNLLLYFQGLVLRSPEKQPDKVRCLICCFEGIGLASYLHSLLKRELDEIEVIDSTAVYKFRQSYLRNNRIDLILSTFPISNVDVPVIEIHLPLKKEQLKRDIMGRMKEVVQTREKMKQELPVTQDYDTADRSLPFEPLLDFISRFELYFMSDKNKLEEIIEDISQHICRVSRQSRQLSEDFLKREDLGPLEFEEYGTRVIHCKSKALSQPCAGVIAFGDEKKGRMIYLAAPDPCPESTRRMLSHITLSFMEHQEFRDALIGGSLNSIRSNLMDIYKVLIA